MHEKAEIAKTVGESLSVAAFKHEFSDCFKDFTLEVNVLATGKASFNNSLRDDYVVQGIALTAAAIDGAVAIIAAVNLITAGVAAAITIPLSIAAIIAVYAYTARRDARQEKEYGRAEKILERNDLLNEVETVSDLLAGLYRVQLESCTVKDAVKLGNSCFKAISSELLKNENFDFNELLYPATLQGVLLRSAWYMDNKKLNMNTMDTGEYSTREMVQKPALYCRETNAFYECSESKPKKYGVLFFDTKQDIDDYIEMVNKIKRNDRKWQYVEMNKTSVSLLRSSSLFKHYNGIEYSEDKHAVEVGVPSVWHA